MVRRSVLIGGMILLVGSIAATAMAQPGGGRGPGGGMGMFGGPGGGSGAMLLGMTEVQKELNVTDEQKKQVTDLLTESRQKMREAFSGFNFQDFQNLTQEEQQKQRDEMRKKMEAATKGIDEKVAKILDDKQVERLHQLQLQQQGAMALTRPEIAEKLKLSEDQQTKIKKIQADARTASRPNFSQDMTQEERQAAFQKMRDTMTKAQKDMLAVLNDDQMLDWTKMCGKEFKFPQLGRGNRGGGAAPTPPPQQ
jgi:hypothetical protein